jgi:thiamine monophosphate synthase
VIAIGGIDAKNAHLIFDAGAKGVAVVSAIFDAPCPKAAAQKIREAQYGFSKV